MTPRKFVSALKREVREDVASTVEYIASPPVPNPPGHLGKFSRWWRGLSAADRRVARDLLCYAAEGSLFSLLNIRDGVHSLDKGHFELFHVKGKSRTRLNNPDGDFLYELFNNSP